MRVLVAEDDLTLQHGLARVLEEAGHHIMARGSGAEVDVLLATEPFDLLILDLGLPDMDGLTVLHRLRRRRLSLPVLVLSARDRTEDRVIGLDSGADDYLTKPFELSEFEARVRALLRRGQGSTVAVGALTWHADSQQLEIDGQAVDLSKSEAIVLGALLQNPGKIMRKEVLARSLGDEEQVGDNVVEVYIHRLRRKLSDAGVEIRTVRGLGYMLREAPADS